MKRYTMRDESALSIDKIVKERHYPPTDENLSLQAVNGMTDFSEQEFEAISEMNVGEKLDFDGITVERTK